MRRVLIVFGVLASGTALSFGAAAAIFLANPDGHLVPNNGGFAGGIRELAVPGKGVPIPVPMPAGVVDDVVIVDDTGAVPPEVDAALKVEIGRGVAVPPVGADEAPHSGTEP